MFDVKKTVDEIIEFIRDYFNKNNLKGVVVGISGGKDSAVVASLFCRALGSSNVLGLWMPCYSTNLDKEDAYLLAKTLNFELMECDLTTIYDTYVNNIKNSNINDSYLIDANINIKSRLRMATLYYYANLESKIKKGIYIVAGTSNKCELFVGYFTKGGDNVSDINVLSNLLVSEVIKIGEYLNVPKKICHKIPHDGLSNLSDEEKLGIKYQDIETFILEKENNLESSLDKDIYNKIDILHQSNLHKFIIPTFRGKYENRDISR